MRLPHSLDEARALHRQVAHRPIDVRNLLSSARTALDEDRLEDAETVVLGALIAAPERVECWRLSAAYSLARGEPDDAEAALRCALELADDEDAALELAVLLASDGRFEEAEGLASVLAMDAESPRIRARADRLATDAARRISA